MSESVSSSNNIKFCGICEQKEARYCCPRCEILYCSLECYKSEKHSECSESFYRNCVNEELMNFCADEETRARTLNMLNRLNEEDDDEDIRKLLEDVDELDLGSLDSDDEDILSLHDRLNGVNLDDPNALWNALTEDERNQFEASANQDDIGMLVPQWQPWWLYRKTEMLVESVEDTAAEHKKEEEALEKCPNLVHVPEFSVLSTVEPSSAIRYNISNVLAAYAFLMRYFNGEPEPVEVAILLLSICANLDNNTNFEYPGSASESVAQRCLQSSVIHTNEASFKVMRHDIIKILLGPSKENKAFYCKAALSHVHQILTEAKRLEKSSKIEEVNSKCDNNSKDKEFSRKFPDHDKMYLSKLDVSKVKKCIKKIEYYISYVESRGMEIIIE